MKSGNKYEGLSTKKVFWNSLKRGFLFLIISLPISFLMWGMYYSPIWLPLYFFILGMISGFFTNLFEKHKQIINSLITSFIIWSLAFLIISYSFDENLLFLFSEAYLLISYTIFYGISFIICWVLFIFSDFITSQYKGDDDKYPISMTVMWIVKIIIFVVIWFMLFMVMEMITFGII
ncbi:MAG: hypothetical protein ABIJ05_00920 [Patescibacteria group bacterium]